MKLLIATDVALIQKDQKVFAKSKYATIFRRYASAFGRIVFFSRVDKNGTVTKDCEEITDITESILAVPSLSMLLLNKMSPILRKTIRDCDLVVGRCPSISAYKAFDCAKKENKPFFAESMGCAWDAYWNHGLAGKAIAPCMFLKMRSVVKNADYALYVTSRFLQKRYPRTGSSIAASNVLIQSTQESLLEKRYQTIDNMDNSKVHLMTTAAVDVRYKGQEYVIRAIPELNKAGIRVEYNIVGEGDASYLQQVAHECQVEDQVHFPGRMPLKQVFELLDECDIYLQPSLQEGLPRSVIEAMSRGCACIGAATAGIPELLESEYVVKRKSVQDIVDCVKMYCHLPMDEKKRLAKRNFDEAANYQVDLLNTRRNDYFAMIKQEIEKHAG